MLLYRIAPEGFLAVTDEDGRLRILHSDPLEVAPGGYELGRRVELEAESLMVPWLPGKLIGIGRNYRDHASELGNPMPAEPLIFLKAISSLIGPGAPIVLPPQSQRVEYEGEIAVYVGRTLRRASAEDAATSVLGVTCACDVTARDLQKKDATFARAKSFDTFCPVGPAILLQPDLDDLTVATRINGEVRQRGHVREMAWGIAEQLSYISHIMTLEPGDLVLTGTPAGVGPLSAGDVVEVEVSGVGVLSNPVEALRR